jgi:hypothetical protein
VSRWHRQPRLTGTPMQGIAVAARLAGQRSHALPQGKTSDCGQLLLHGRQLETFSSAALLAAGFEAGEEAVASALRSAFVSVLAGRPA